MNEQFWASEPTIIDLIIVLGALIFVYLTTRFDFFKGEEE